jgi:hypothetical protein
MFSASMSKLTLSQEEATEYTHFDPGRAPDWPRILSGDFLATRPNSFFTAT